MDSDQQVIVQSFQLGRLVGIAVALALAVFLSLSFFKRYRLSHQPISFILTSLTALGTVSFGFFAGIPMLVVNYLVARSLGHSQSSPLSMDLDTAVYLAGQRNGAGDENEAALPEEKKYFVRPWGIQMPLFSYFAMQNAAIFFLGWVIIENRARMTPLSTQFFWGAVVIGILEIGEGAWVAYRFWREQGAVSRQRQSH